MGNQRLNTIGLDLRPTEPGFKAHCGRGTGRYTSELLSEFLANPELSEKSGFCFKALYWEQLRGTGFERRLLSRIPAGRMTFETQFILPRAMARTGVDFIHFFAHGDAPAWSTADYIVTVLDLIPLRLPELYRADKPNWRFRLARFLENRAIKSARGVIAISEATKRDLIELLGVSPEKIVVTPLAVSRSFSPLTPEERLREREDLCRKLGVSPERPVLLYVGGIDPRKNVEFLIRVFGQLYRTLPESQRPALLMAGKYANEDCLPRLLAAIDAEQLREAVHLLGFVSDEDLPSLYRSVDLTLFPSLYEGFGLPVLESMASATPVVCGRNSSLPEVAQSAGVLLADNDLKLWLSEIIALLAAPEKRIALGEMGAARAKLFSWRSTAEKTLDAYRYFLQRRRR